jgi:integrative and conjugative element protein (TIGR02256 family)
MTKEAVSKFSNETGGLLMGYLNESGRAVVVTDLIGPGPKAKHRRYAFVPDYDFQEKQIERIYFKSKRLHTYLGDWHTHPNGSSSLSPTDIKALSNIAHYPKARAPFPIMLLLVGNPNNWEIKSWQLKPRRLMKFVFANCLIELNKNFY